MPRLPAALLTVWLCFVVRGCWYACLLPLWEGYDEWSHYAYIQHLRVHRAFPTTASTISSEIAASLALTPVPGSQGNASLSHLTHDAYWHLPKAEQDRRAEEQARLSPALAQQSAHSSLLVYEAQQPPLYYALLAMPDAWLQRRPLTERILALRLLSVLLASTTVLLLYQAAVLVLPRRAGLGVVALATAMPGFLIDVARIGNDGLVIPLVTALLLALLQALRGTARIQQAAVVGVLLGLALLCKAYVLALLPLPGLLALLQVWRRPAAWRSIVAGLALTWGIAVLLAGGWFAKSLWETGTLSGEQLDVASARLGWGAKLHATGQMDWLKALDALGFTHIWMGGWSFLMVRSWMYHLIELLAAGALLGLWLLGCQLVRHAWLRRQPGVLLSRLLLLSAGCSSFCVGLAYYAVVVFSTRGLAFTPGWYLFGVVAAEVLLAAAGIGQLAGRQRLPLGLACAVFLLMALDLYGSHFLLLPYYTGVIAHQADGRLATFHIHDLARVSGPEMMRRIAMNKAPALSSGLGLLWGAYLVATCCLPWLCLASPRKWSP